MSVGSGECLGLGAVGPQYGDGDDVLHTALRHATEDTTGTDLHERPDTQLVQSPHTVRETNRLAHVPNPIRRGVRLGQTTREVRNDRNPRLVEDQPADDLAELLQHRIHQRRMERVAHLQARRLTTLTGEQLRNRQNRILNTGNHHRGGTVDRGDAHAVGQVGQHLVLDGLYGNHRTASRQRLHQTRTRRHQPRRILK
ncbi:hypothetical protein GCM10010422_01680 [Streptomyces graminearus]|uniref:Uncharacterized protein n=1 Tax=Streptomyces graminearus TaxID=284030 RepID=A0ABP5XQH6_9ACTN